MRPGHAVNPPGAQGQNHRLGNAERDFVTLGIATAAIILFVGTGSSVVAPIVRSMLGVGPGPDRMLVCAMLLNIALIIFGWRRYKQLATEVNERRKAEDQARVLAETDPLTGCLNRRTLHDMAGELIAQCREGECLGVLMIDLDNFKHVNDYHGHAAGDLILVECANRIRAELPPGTVLARLGGDEFACVLAFDNRRPETISNLAAAIIDRFSAPVACNASHMTVTASIGLARSDQVEAGVPADRVAHDLLHMADIAMYQAKQQGRNRQLWFESALGDELRFRQELESGVRLGIARGEFVPYYEQQIDIETGELTGFEMLARWHSPTLGEVSPEVFIPVAEGIGAIADLSQGIIAQALEDAKDWDPKLSLAVNISPLQLRDPWFAQKLLKMLVEANFPPQRLEIEITESCLHENIAVVRSLISSLKNQGIKVSLDDFGTGYSSLAQLRNLPFDRIKIDRSFVTKLPESEDSAAIVHAIALLGKGLGLPVTVEGIENDEVLAMLRQYGDVKGQGFLYGRPQPAAAIRERLAQLNLLTLPQAETEPGHEPAPEAGSRRASAR